MPETLTIENVKDNHEIKVSFKEIEEPEEET